MGRPKATSMPWVTVSSSSGERLHSPVTAQFQNSGAAAHRRIPEGTGTLSQDKPRLLQQEQRPAEALRHIPQISANA